MAILRVSVDLTRYDSIVDSGGNMYPNQDGKVYATPFILSAQDVNNVIFMGGPPGYEEKGEYFISFRLNDGVQLIPSSKSGEFFYPGALRNGRQITVIGGGKNEF